MTDNTPASVTGPRACPGTIAPRLIPAGQARQQGTRRGFASRAVTRVRPGDHSSTDPGYLPDDGLGHRGGDGDPGRGNHARGTRCNHADRKRDGDKHGDPGFGIGRKWVGTDQKQRGLDERDNRQ